MHRDASSVSILEEFYYSNEGSNLLSSKNPDLIHGLIFICR